MHILFTRFPLESLLGGAEVQTLSLMKELLSRGHRVSFMGSCPVLLKESPTIGVQTMQLDIGNPPVTKKDALSFLWRKRAMRKQLERALDSVPTPDVVCMISLSEKILLTHYALSKGLNVLWIEHDSIGRWLRGNPWLSTIRKLSNNVKTVCVSELSGELYRTMGYTNVHCIPNGVTPPSAPHTPVPQPDSSLRIGCIARLNPEKGVHILAKAVTHFPNVHLLINGRGEQVIEEHERIRIVNRVDDIDDIYKQIDVLVLPSIDNDPFGLVVAEAMLRNIPVICTTACGISKYLTSGDDSLVVKAGSDVALRDAIEMMLDPDVRAQLAHNGKKTAEEHFTVERMVDQYEQLFSV